MTAEVLSSMITGACTIVAALIAIIFAKKASDNAKKASDDAKKTSSEVGEMLSEYNKFKFIRGERAAFEELTKITLTEPDRLMVTRFNPRAIQRQKEYFDAIELRITGKECKQLARYNRLVSLNSKENKKSLLDQIDTFLEKKCDNLVIKVTKKRNDFEVIIAESLHTVVFCFHDWSNEAVVNSCFVTSDTDLYSNFLQLYEKMWNDDILMEIDFSLGEDNVRSMRDKLEKMDIGQA